LVAKSLQHLRWSVREDYVVWPPLAISPRSGFVQPIIPPDLHKKPRSPVTSDVGRLRRLRASGIINIMIDWSTCPAVERDPERVSGAWVFRDTRVPVAALFENLEDGALVSQFVEWFPGVTIEQVRAVLEHAARSALAPA
jgi:uncharacterized protein (DUF433 family)